MSDSPQSIAILGAGITGLTAAHRLAKQGHRVRVFEKNNRVGGAVGTDIIDGWLCERGPNSLLEGNPAVTTLIRELGLEGERLPANPAAKRRYLVRGGRPLATPSSPPSLISSPLFSFGAKMRLISELFKKPRKRPADISLAELVQSHFGREIVNYALNPFIGGVYAGDPRKLSARHSFPSLWAMEQEHGSLIRGQIAQAKKRRSEGIPRGGIISFKRGLQTLTDALADQLPEGALTLNASIETLINDSHWHIIWNDGQGAHNEEFDLVISALPAGPLSRLHVGTLAERPLASLNGIIHPPVDSLVLGYRHDQISHPLDGFGMLVPEIEKRSVLGILFSSTLFPGRAPEGHHALTVMIGGTRQPELTGLDTEELIKRIQPDLKELLGVSGKAVFQKHNTWERAIPQYNLGHETYLETISHCEEQYPGFFIGGQARDGISLPDCISAGEKLATRAVKS